ncbi:MAG: ricin-type beta-trefoil lectin domain protein [Bdellovibrionia bacterium]
MSIFAGQTALLKRATPWAGSMALVLISTIAPASANVCTKAPEDASASLSCPSGQVVSKVVFASYGNPVGSCGSYTASSCNASSSLSKVQASCLGKASCSIIASNSVFGDPCSGVDKSLAFEVQCAAPSTVTTVASGAVKSGLSANLCLDVVAESKASGAALQIYSCNGGSNQSFVLNSAGQLKSFAGAGNLCVDIKGTGANLNPIVSNTCNGAASQKWSLSNGRLVSASSGRCIDVKASGTANGTPVILYDCSTGANQKWTFASGAVPSPTPTPKPSPSPSASPSPSPSPTVTAAPVGGALPTDSVFASTSFWYTPIPANAPLHANSAKMVQSIIDQKAKYYGTASINTEAYSSPVYIAPAGAATVKVNAWDCQSKGYLDPNLQAQFAQVPIPSNALAAEGTDMEMTVYQPSTDTIWEFWQMQKTGGQWEACWGGRLQQASKSQGIFPGSYGTTATSLPFLGGQITAEELQRGEIRHAIGIALVDMAAWNVFSWPAQRSDGNGAGIIPEGLRLRLDPNVNVDALNIHPVAKIIAKAAQKYGFVVWDHSGSISIRAQNVISYTAVGKVDPYHGANGASGLFQGKADWQILEGFPWDKLQFLPMNYGKP